MKKIKVELTVERRQRLAIRRANTLSQARCDACGEKVVMLSGEEAAKLNCIRNDNSRQSTLALLTVVLVMTITQAPVERRQQK